MLRALSSIVFFSIISIATANAAEVKGDFVDVEIRSDVHSLMSPEINTIIYITPKRNLKLLKAGFMLYGLTTTTKPVDQQEPLVYRNVYMGETIKIKMPIYISSTKNNYATLDLTSIDKTNLVKKESVKFKISNTTDSVEIIE